MECPERGTIASCASAPPAPASRPSEHSSLRRRAARRAARDVPIHRGGAERSPRSHERRPERGADDPHASASPALASRPSEHSSLSRRAARRAARDVPIHRGGAERSPRKTGSPARIRTSTSRVRICGPTVRRPGNATRWPPRPGRPEGAQNREFRAVCFTPSARWRPKSRTPARRVQTSRAQRALLGLRRELSRGPRRLRPPRGLRGSRGPCR